MGEESEADVSVRPNLDDNQGLRDEITDDLSEFEFNPVDLDDTPESLIDEMDDNQDEGQNLVYQMEARMNEDCGVYSAAGFNRLPCFPHTMQLAYLKAILEAESFGKVLNKTKKLVVKYKTSVLA